MSTILGIANADAQGVNEPLPSIFICVDISTPKIFYSFWLAPLVFEFILCFLAIRIGVKRSMLNQGHATLISGTRLINLVITGNILYFVVILLACIVNAAMWQGLPSNMWVEVPEGFPQAIEVIAGCHLILHIRNATTRPLNETAPNSQLVFHYPMQRFPPKYASEMDVDDI
ncbi:hypothetical protein HYDPIDRAFT_116381 [Hydnomerulius pinastri MD-312]|uniref:Uncharacterized protein n=1 Tax=Hydnomerulius pinastri MD-312 TaxID=994086 RepID=A0A0C9V680_9AGAM|nr:hypothetical protein HYDPIDRAFT_116381 [Hydnomerulius pinastri MD-312]